MSIEDLEEIKKDFVENRADPMNWKNANGIIQFMGHTISIFKNQSDQIADLRQELAKKEDAINIGDVIKEARLRNG